MDVLKDENTIINSESTIDKNNCISIVRQGLPYKNRAVDRDVWLWRNTLLMSRGGKLVTKSEVQNYAREAYIKAGIFNFKASDGWYRRWLSRQTSVGLQKDKVSDMKLTSKNNQEIKEIKLKNIKNQRVCKVKYHSWEESELPKNKHVNDKTKTMDIEVDSKSYNFTKSETDNLSTSPDYVNVEKERNSCNVEDLGNEPVLESINNYSLTNSKSCTFPINESETIIEKVSKSDVENNMQQNVSTFLPQKEMFKDAVLSIDNSSMDDFFYTSILDSSGDTYKDCDDIIPKNFLKNKTSPNFVNSELFFNNNNTKKLQNCASLTSSSGENGEILSINRRKQLGCDDKDLNVNKVHRKGERYLPHFKTKVATCAASSSIKSAAVKFNVSRGTVSDWLKEKERNTTLQLISKKLPSTENTEAADLVFIKWLEDHQDKLSRPLVVKKTLELFQQYGAVVLEKTCPWFLAYIKRLNENKLDQKLHCKKYIIYPEKFKLQVAKYAQKCSQLAAARLFLIARKRVFDWLSKVKSTGTIGAKNPVNPSSYVTDSEVDNQIWKWYNEQPVTPSSKQVREKGRQLYKKAGYTLSCSHGWYYRWRSRLGLPNASSGNTTHDSYILEWILTKLDNNENISHGDILTEASNLKKSSVKTQFKSSLGWVLRFCKRHPELLQTIPDATVQLPAAMESKVRNFKDNFLSCIKEGNISLENIVAMDEIPLHFLLTGNNKRKLLVRRPGFDTCQGSLVISCLANGTLLPFMLILKGTVHSVSECNSSNNFVVVSENGCMDANIMLLWLQRICFTKVIGKGILLNDCFERHTCTQAVEQLAARKFQHLVIPGGCSSKLQPLNQITQHIKCKVEQHWAVLLTAECWSDGTCHLKSPSHSQICDWVQKSYSSLAIIEKDNVKKAFQHMYSMSDTLFPNEEIAVV